MIEATKNQLTNVNNKFQGNSKKVLCACSAGLLRSPTLANVLNQELGYNTRSCGTASSFALIPISEALIHWADEIIFVDTSCKEHLDYDTEYEIEFSGAKIITLNVPDEFDYGTEELKRILLEHYLLSD